MTQENVNVAPTSVLDSLVGPGKKFADAESLAKGKADSDAFIVTLQREKAEALDLAARQDTRIKSLESKISILDRLAVTPDSGTQTVTVQNQTPTEPQFKGLTEEDVLKVVEKRDLNARQLANKQTVDVALTKVFGADAANKVRGRLAELGVDPTEFNQLAVSSPNGAFALLQIDPNATQGSTTYRGTGHDPTSINGRPEVRNSSWYEAKKREMGALKFMKDTRLMIQRHNDMVALGDGWDN